MTEGRCNFHVIRSMLNAEPGLSILDWNDTTDDETHLWPLTLWLLVEHHGQYEDGEEWEYRAVEPWSYQESWKLVGEDWGNNLQCFTRAFPKYHVEWGPTEAMQQQMAALSHGGQP